MFLGTSWDVDWESGMLKTKHPQAPYKAVLCLLRVLTSAPPRALEGPAGDNHKPNLEEEEGLGRDVQLLPVLTAADKGAGAFNTALSPFGVGCHPGGRWL